MKQKKKLKKRRRPLVQKDRPVNISGTLSGFELQSRFLKPFWRFLEKVVGVIPSQRNTQGGRANATFVRGLFFVAAFVLLGISIELWPLAAIVGLIGLPLPIRHSKKTLWISKLQAHQKPIEVPSKEPGSLDYDGRKISLRRSGKVERSVRPNEEPTNVIIRANDGTAWMGFVPKKESKKRAIWLKAPNSHFPDYIEEQGQVEIPDGTDPLIVTVKDLSQIALSFAILAPLQPDEEWPY